MIWRGEGGYNKRSTYIVRGGYKKVIRGGYKKVIRAVPKKKKHIFKIEMIYNILLRLRLN